MNTTTATKTNTETNNRIVISGPPALAKAGSVLSAAIAIGSAFAWPNPYAVTATLLGAVVAWRLARLAIVIERDELILRNLFATSRISVENAKVRRVSTDLRLRVGWGPQILPSEFIPKMNDDNMATKATIICIEDLSDNDFSAHTDCSIGLLADSQNQLFNELQTVIEGAEVH